MDSLAPCDMRWNNFVRMSWVKKGKRQPIRVKKNKRQPTRVTSSKGGRRLTNVTLSPQNYCSVEQHPKDKHYSAYVTCCYILCCCSLNGHLHCTCKCCIKNVTFFFFFMKLSWVARQLGKLSQHIKPSLVLPSQQNDVQTFSQTAFHSSPANCRATSQIALHP